MHRLNELAFHVGVPDMASARGVDAYGVREIRRQHQADIGNVAREKLEVVRLRAVVCDFAVGSALRRNGNGVVAARVVRAAGDSTIDDVIGSDRKSVLIKPAQHRVVVPPRLRPQLADAAPVGVVGQRVQQAAADARALRVVARADRLDGQRRDVAAEFAFEHARQHVAGEMIVEHRRELDVRGGLAQRGGESPLEIGTACPAFRDRVDVHDRVEIGARQPAQRRVADGNGFHAISFKPRRMRTTGRGRRRRRADLRAAAITPSFPSEYGQPAVRPSRARPA